MFGIEVIVDAIYLSVGSSVGIEYANAALYLLVAAGLSVFFIYTTSRIIHTLISLGVTTHSTSSNSDCNTSASHKPGQSHLLRTAIKISIGGFSLLLLAASALLFAAARDFAYRMIPWTVIWLTVHTAANVKAISTIVAFVPRQQGQKDRSQTATAATRSRVRTNSASHV